MPMLILFLRDMVIALRTTVGAMALTAIVYEDVTLSSN